MHSNLVTAELALGTMHMKQLHRTAKISEEFLKVNFYVLDKSTEKIKLQDRLESPKL